MEMSDFSDVFSAEVVEFFNTELGNDLKNLEKIQEVVDRLTRYEKELELEVDPQSVDPESTVNAVQNAERVMGKIEELTRRCGDLQVTADAELETIGKMKDNFSAQLKELKEAESLYNYLQWILKIEKQNSNMEEALKTSSHSQMVNIYSNYKEVWGQLRLSQCKHLVNYVTRTMVYWHGVLQEKFGSEFQKVLVNLQWPLSPTCRVMSKTQTEEALMKFQQLFVTLCDISLPDAYIRTQDMRDEADPSILLPIQLMIQPLQKRFLFHFMGKKPTNRLDKPEWYLTQILSWISDHSLFLEKTVEPIIARENMLCSSSCMQFMRGVVQLAMLRFKADLPSLLEDDRLLSHAIDEVLLFAQELHNLGYPSTFPNIMQILASEPCFARWRSLEHQSALEKMDKFLSLESAWKSRYQEESELDEMHVPESAELFVTLLLTMTERYCNIPERECQISFLELQLELLDDFRLRLHQLSQCQETIEFSYCGIMNAIHYITLVLEEWNNLPFFLQLHSYKKRRSVCESLLRESEMSLCSSPKRKMSKALADEGGVVECSIFEDAIHLFEHMQRDLLHLMCDRVMLDIKAKSRPYRKEKWFCVPVPEDRRLVEVSLSAYPMLEVIKVSLHTLQEMLSKTLFTKVWQQIATELNLFIYEEVVLQNNFSEGGAAQLSFDMTRNLFPIFGSYTLKPENHFKLVRDSCLLLSLSHAPSMLLRETLRHQEGPTKCLEELGVFHLSPSEALLILSQRNHTIT